MSGTVKEVVGRATEAVGAITGSERLRMKGRTEQLVGKSKRGAHKAKKSAEKTMSRIADKVKQH